MLHVPVRVLRYRREHGAGWCQFSPIICFGTPNYVQASIESLKYRGKDVVTEGYHRIDLRLTAHHIKCISRVHQHAANVLRERPKGVEERVKVLEYVFECIRRLDEHVLSTSKILVVLIPLHVRTNRTVASIHLLHGEIARTVVWPGERCAYPAQNMEDRLQLVVVFGLEVLQNAVRHE